MVTQTIHNLIMLIMLTMHLLITDLVTVKARKDFYRILYINTFLKIMDYNFAFVFSFQTLSSLKNFVKYY